MQRIRTYASSRDVILLQRQHYLFGVRQPQRFFLTVYYCVSWRWMAWDRPFKASPWRPRRRVPCLSQLPFVRLLEGTPPANRSGPKAHLIRYSRSILPWIRCYASRSDCALWTAFGKTKHPSSSLSPSDQQYILYRRSEINFTAATESREVSA